MRAPIDWDFFLGKKQNFPPSWRDLIFIHLLARLVNLLRVKACSALSSVLRLEWQVKHIESLLSCVSKELSDHSRKKSESRKQRFMTEDNVMEEGL